MRTRERGGIRDLTRDRIPGRARGRTRGRTWGRTRARTRGFTLIELLVTITIVAILVGAVVLNIEFRNPGKVVRDVSLRTKLIMELAADQAVYARQQFGIRFHPDSYEFWVLAPSEEEGEEPAWQPFEDERLRYAAPDMPVEFQVDISGVPIVLEDLVDELDDATEEDPLKPHVLFLSNGEIMPDFRVLIADPDGEFRHEVRTGEVEPLVVEALESDS